MTYKLPVSLIMVSLLTACTHIPSSKEVDRMSVPAKKSIIALNNAPLKHISYRPSKQISDQISPQDVLNVNVFKVPDLSVQNVKVEENGKISLPLIGLVKVEGLSIANAEKTIAKRLTQYLQDPKVTVTRTDKAIIKRVTVEGEVRTPGVFPIKGNLSFLQAIAMSQGLSELADTNNVLLYRDGTQHNVNLELVRLGKIQDPLLRSDDRIVVLKNKSKVIEKKFIDYVPAVVSPFSLFRY